MKKQSFNQRKPRKYFADNYYLRRGLSNPNEVTLTFTSQYSAGLRDYVDKWIGFMKDESRIDPQETSEHSKEILGVCLKNKKTGKIHSLPLPCTYTDVFLQLCEQKEYLHGDKFSQGFYTKKM